MMPGFQHAGWQRPTSADDGLNELLYYSFAYLNTQGYANFTFPVLVRLSCVSLDHVKNTNVVTLHQACNVSFWLQ